MYQSQKGFAAVEALLILIIVALVAGTGYYVWHGNKQADTTYNGASQVAQSSPAAKTKSKAQATDQSQAALVITQWGIKVSFPDASKVTYVLNGDTADFLLRPSVTTIKACQELGVGISRDAPAGQTEATNSVIALDGHTYALTGSPAACDDGASSKPSSLNQLRAKITGDELPEAAITAAS